MKNLSECSFAIGLEVMASQLGSREDEGLNSLIDPDFIPEFTIISRGLTDENTLDQLHRCSELMNEMLNVPWHSMIDDSSSLESVIEILAKITGSLGEVIALSSNDHASLQLTAVRLARIIDEKFNALIVKCDALNRYLASTN